MTVLWDVAPCSLADFDGRFRGDYILYHQGEVQQFDIYHIMFAIVTHFTPNQCMMHTYNQLRC
jgi:hypothetical protein